MSDSEKQPTPHGGDVRGDARNYLVSPDASASSGGKGLPPQESSNPVIVVSAADCKQPETAGVPPPPPFGTVALPRTGWPSNQYLSPSGADAPARKPGGHAGASADASEVESVFTQEDIQRMIEDDSLKRIAVVHGTVFDVTNFAPHHPGGSGVFVTGNGKDVTATFDAMHGPKARAKLMHWAIGKFSKERPPRQEAATSGQDHRRGAPAGGSGGSGSGHRPGIPSVKHYATEDGSAPGKGHKSPEEMDREDIESRIRENPESIILIMFGDVYDVTSFANEHPGGVRVLASSNGRECGETFMRIHGLRAREMVKRYYIGRLKDSFQTASPLRGAMPTAGAGSPVSIFRQRASSTRLLAKEPLGSCSDIRYFTFACPFKMNVPPGGHIKIYSNVDTGAGRYYTPFKTELASFSLCVKLYPHGVTSSYLFNLSEGDEVFYEGPFAPAWAPHTDPYLTDTRLANTEKHVLLIAGGTGVSPLYTVAKDLLQRQAAQVTLLLAVSNRDHLLLGEELAALEERYSRTGECCFAVFVVFSQSFSSAGAEASGTASERGGLRLSRQNTLFGRIDTNLLRRVPLPKSTQAVAVCGPPAFNSSISRYVVEAAICGEKRVHVFE